MHWFCPSSSALCLLVCFYRQPKVRACGHIITTIFNVTEHQPLNRELVFAIGQPYELLVSNGMVVIQRLLSQIVLRENIIVKNF